MERLDLIIIAAYKRGHLKILILISWETENYLGGFLVLLGWLPILILLVQ